MSGYSLAVWLTKKLILINRSTPFGVLFLFSYIYFRVNLYEGKRVMEEKGNREKDFLEFQINRKVKNLYKNFLFILEDLKDQDYNIDEETYQKLRKRVLDHGNDATREIEDYLDNFDIKLR